MTFKCVFLFCISAVYVNSAVSQCISREGVLGAGVAGPHGWPYEGPYEGYSHGPAWAPAGCGIGPASFVPAGGLAANYGGGLNVISSSPITPTGLTVNSENAIEGTLAVVGQLPFLGAVATDGAFATVGAGSVSYGCGDGAIGIVSEAPTAPAVGPGYGSGLSPYSFGPAMTGFNQMAPLGCGCGMF